MEETAVKVCVRVRPLIDNELSRKCTSVAQYSGANEITLTGGDNRFTFDYVYNEEKRQAELYEEVVSPVVANFLNGYNTTILAYGQTASGKTFTMGTAGKQEGVPPEDVGIIPRVVQHLFGALQENKDTEHEVRVCFVEIYNEQIRDLLAPPNSLTTLAIREGLGGEISVFGAEEAVVTSADGLLQCLDRGSQNRSTGATAMNQTSSRSHAVFTVTLAQKKRRPSAPAEEKEEKASSRDSLGSDKSEDDEDDEVLTSKFHFVDLAGSERLKRTGATGERMKEGININCGLLALANCISALAEQKRGHVPFRDSKITRMLQDSLGGNSQTLMIACISPADVNVEESLNTLRYANRARNIKNKPIINRDPNMQKMARMRSRIQELETLLALQGAVVPSEGLKSAANTTVVSHAEYKLLQDQVAVYSLQMQRLDSRLAETQAAFVEAQNQLLLSQQKCDELSALVPPGSKLTPQDSTLLASLTECRAELLTQGNVLEKALSELHVKQRLLNAFEERYGKADTEMLRWACSEPRQRVDESVLDESEASMLNSIADLKNREHELKMQNLTRVMHNLDSEIRKKELMMEQLSQEREGTQTYSMRIEQVESQVREVQKAKDEQAALAHGEAQKELVARYNRKIDDLNQQLKALREKLKDHATLKGRLDQDEKRILALRDEIAASKQQKVQLQQQMKEKAEAYHQWMKEKERKLSAMTKQSLKQQRTMGKLQNELEKQAGTLKRANDQKADLRQKLDAERDKNKTLNALQKRGPVSVPAIAGIKRSLSGQPIQRPKVESKPAFIVGAKANVLGKPGARVPLAPRPVNRPFPGKPDDLKRRSSILPKLEEVVVYADKENSAPEENNAEIQKENHLPEKNDQQNDIEKENFRVVENEKENFQLQEKNDFSANNNEQINLLETDQEMVFRDAEKVLAQLQEGEEDGEIHILERKPSVMINHEKEENFNPVPYPENEILNVVVGVENEPDKKNDAFLVEENKVPESLPINQENEQREADEKLFFFEKKLLEHNDEEEKCVPRNNENSGSGGKNEENVVVHQQVSFDLSPGPTPERASAPPKSPFHSPRAGFVPKTPTFAQPEAVGQTPGLVVLQTPELSQAAGRRPPETPVFLSPGDYPSPPLRRSVRKRKSTPCLGTPMSGKRVPRKQDAESVDISSSMKALEKEIVQLFNTASARELTKISMIGKKRVQLILANRDLEMFTSVEDCLTRIGFTQRGILEFKKRNMMGKIWDVHDLNVLHHVA